MNHEKIEAVDAGQVHQKRVRSRFMYIRTYSKQSLHCQVSLYNETVCNTLDHGIVLRVAYDAFQGQLHSGGVEDSSQEEPEKE